MGQHSPGFFERLGLGQSLKRWRRALRAGGLSAAELRAMLFEMRSLRNKLDTLTAEAQTALMRRGADAALSINDIQCDWSGRPGAWREAMRPRGIVDLPSPSTLSGGVTVYHDAARYDLSLRQEMAPESYGDARYGLVLEVYRFDGSFVSFVHDLPEEAIAGLTLNHFLAVDIKAEREQPIEVYARLNVQHGPNVEQMVRQVDFHGQDGRAEFDLAYTRINERRIEKAWLDLILEGPEMTRIALWDVVVMRAPRADV
jgi:hypothetical protein